MLSYTVTCLPSDNNRSTRWLPMKPAPPVTKCFLNESSFDIDFLRCSYGRTHPNGSINTLNQPQSLEAVTPAAQRFPSVPKGGRKFFPLRFERGVLAAVF